MKKLLLLIPMFFLISCMRKKMANVGDDSVKIQVMGLINSDDGFEYNVRINHDFKGSEVQQIKLNEMMSYRMDSAFMIKNGNTENYADEIIPIASGKKNCFEYLVIFNDAKLAKNTLMYKDKHISGKTYALDLK